MDTRPVAIPPADPGRDGSGEPDDEVSLGEYLDVLVASRWLVLGAFLLALGAGVAYAILATPVYRSDVLVQVEDKKAGMGGLSDLSQLFGESSPAETEIEILRSRSLVGGVVDELRLDIQADPRRFPLVGRALARRHDGDAPAAALWGFGAYGWGGEKIAISRLAVPSELEGKALTLVALDGGRYVVRDPDGAALLEGEVGASASGRGVDLHVTDLVARPGTQFRVRHFPRDIATAGLQEDLRIAEKGKKTGVLQIALEGTDPRKTAAILDSLARAYLRQNVERKSAEAQKTLDFLETQLPVLRGNMEAAERELESYRARHSSVDVTLETQAAVTRAVEIEKAASELQVEYAALRQKFTEEHPAIIAVRQKLDRLAAERAAMDGRLKKLPTAQLEAAKRLRDQKVASELYLTLLNRAQELKIVREGTIGNVRILDAAIVPIAPIAPRKTSVLALSALLGLGLGVALAFGRRALDVGVDDPEKVERAVGVGVHAAVAHSPSHSAAVRRAARDHTAIPILADVEPKDLAVESLRSLRTSLEFALLDAPGNVIAIGGPAPGVGKSFVSVNLAHLLGETGKRIVVVDGDLRRGHLHRFYGLDRSKGLSDVIGGHVALADAVRATGSPNVRFVSTGTIPPNPSELLGSERFRALLAELSRGHDLVLIDTPPALAVADAAIVARLAAVNLFVLKSGRHPLREIAAAVRVLARNGIRLNGIVMNDVRLDRGLGRRNTYHYQYRYE